MNVVDQTGLTRFWGKVKTLVADCLPKTGGTVSGDFGALTIKRTANDYSAIRYLGSSGTTLGYIGCNPSKQPLFTPDGTNLHTIYHSGNLTLSTLGAAASSHSHSNYADKTSTSASLTSLNTAVGTIGTQLASDEANISGLQSDVYNLKSYFSSGVANNASKLGGVAASDYLKKVTVANNTSNDFNTFASMTLTGRGDPVSGASLANAPWTGSGPAGGYGVFTYLWSGYGTQLAVGYNSNRIYIRNKYYSNSSTVWSTTWNSIALSGEAQPASDVYAWAKASTKPTYTASEVGAAASSHSHSNYADKTSTSSSLTSLNTAVGNIGTQLASDEANISGLQADVSTLKGYFSSGVAKNASKLGNVAASSYALKTDIPSSLPANGGNADTTDGLHVHSGRNNEANKIVRTDGNGYIQAGWINTTSGGFNNRGTVHGVDNVPTALNRIFCSEDDYLRYLSPAMFKRAVGLAERIHFGSQNTPGAYCKIKINSATSWMLYFRVRVYQSYNYYDIDISGYNYGSSYWYSPKATLVSSSVDSIAVTFGYDSAYNLWVSFPTSSYIGVDVVDAVNGYTQVDNIGSLFQISFSSSIPATAQTTVTAYRTLHKGDSAPASDVYAWAKASSKPSYTASEVGAAASSHSHSNYADKTSTSSSLTSLNTAVGNIGTQLASDEANISGLQGDVYNLKSYFSSGVAKDASKLGGVAASSYATQSWVTGKGYTTNKGTVTSVSIKVNGSVKGTITTSGTIDLGSIGGSGGGPAVSTGTAVPSSSKSGAVGDIYSAYINSQYRMWLCLGQVYTNTWLWREIQFIN